MSSNGFSNLRDDMVLEVDFEKREEKGDLEYLEGVPELGCPEEEEEEEEEEEDARMRSGKLADLERIS